MRVTRCAGVAIVAIALWQALTACGESRGGIPPVFTPRDPALSVDAIGDAVVTDVGIEGVAPLQVALLCDAGNSDRDVYHQPDVFTKVEVDFGDGSGWVDVTTDAKTKWFKGPEYWKPENKTQHTYTTPGEFSINARLTYWDGEVVYARQDPIPVHVLPAGNAP